MSLHVEKMGAGAPLMLIHGWGMHGGMWGEMLEKLAQHYTVHSVDFPGHGKSAHIAPYDLDALVASVSAYVRKNNFAQPLTVCGWSLGGQVALRWAQHAPVQVSKIILLASTPCFVQRADWPCAMPSATFQAFEQDLQQGAERTLKRFIALQARGSERERECLAHLRGSLLNHGQAHHAALREGLVILRETDLRALLSHISQPVLVVAGEFDSLTPMPAAQYLAEHLPNAKMVTIKGAAHVPFLSHPDELVMQLKKFMDHPQ